MRPSWTHAVMRGRPGLGSASTGQNTRHHLLLSEIMTDASQLEFPFSIYLHVSPSWDPSWKCSSLSISSLLALMVILHWAPTGESEPGVPQKVPGRGVWSPGLHAEASVLGGWAAPSPCLAPPLCLRSTKSVGVIYYDGVKLKFSFL